MIKVLIIALALSPVLRADLDPNQLRRANANIQQLLLGKAIVCEAEKHCGEPYVWGGKNEQKDGGLDCSGFTATVYKTFGIELPVSAMKQYEGGFSIGKPALMPGDLLFFASTPMHVGIYAGDGKFLHAPRSGKRIGLESLGKRYFAVRYLGARRYPPPPKSATRETKL